MKSRDRILLIVLLGAGLLAGFWFVVLGPKRQEAKELSAKVISAQERLAQAQAAARNAEQAKAGYERDYATVVELGKAVPAEERVPSLLYQLESASRNARISFNSIKTSGAPAGAPTATPAAQVAAVGQAEKNPSAPASGSSPSAAPAGTTVGTAGFPTMPFTFEFEGSYEDLRHLVHAVNRFVEVHGSEIVVRGRLLQIDGISLTPQTGENATRVTATVNATAYLLPPEQGPTNGATSSAPPGAAPTGATGASSTTTAVTTTSTAGSSGETR